MLKRLNSWLLVFMSGLLLLTELAYAQTATVRSQLSSTVITRDETVTLEIVATGLDEALDVSALDDDFEVVGRSSSREVSTIIGADNQPQVTSTVRWALELVPKGVGVFTVPAVKVGKMSSQIHTLTVNELPSGAQRDLFVEASVDNDSPWVQSQVVLTLRVYQAVNIIDGGLDSPAGEGLVVERLGDDTRTQETREGRRYSVTERKFAIFPQRSGSLIIEPITLSVSVPVTNSGGRGFFSPSRKLTRRTEAIPLSVHARPDAGAAWWLPATSVSIESSWVGGLDEPTVNKPLTRSIKIRAVGVTSSQLPDLSTPEVQGAGIYAEQPVNVTSFDGQGLVAEQTINWAVIPQLEGSLTLPAIAVDWFNVTTGQTETALLNQEVLTISPAKSASTNTVPQVTLNNSMSGATEQNSARLGSNPIPLPDSIDDPADKALSTDLEERASRLDTSEMALFAERVGTLENALFWWRIAALLAALVASLSIVWVLWYQRKIPLIKRAAGQLEADSPQNSQKLVVPVIFGGWVSSDRLERYCKGGDLSLVQQALLDWSAKQWPQSAPRTLGELARQLPSSDARRTITRLDESLYGRGVASEQLIDLRNALAELPTQLKQVFKLQRGSVSNKPNAEGLPPL